MKSRILLLLLIASTSLLSCKKDKQLAPDQLTVIKSQILATWQLTSYKEVYYEANGTAVPSPEAEVSADSKFQFTDENTFKRFYPSEREFNYTLANVNGKVIMTLDEQPYEISISNDTMTWYIEQELQDQTYVKATGTYQFKKL